MKRVILLIFSINVLFANWISLKPDWFSSKPEWISKHNNYSFVGISAPKETKQLAIKDAVSNALEQVSNRLGVVVNSEFSSQKSLKSDYISKNIKVSTNLKSFAKIEDYEVKKSYCDPNDEKFTCYVLISFTKDKFLKLKKETQQRINRLNKLISEFETAINNLNYDKAKSIYEQIILIPESNYNFRFKRLVKQFNSMINLKISDIKDEVLPLEEIKFSLFANQDGFLYVIYNNGIIPKLIFPQNHQNNKIKKNQAFILPSPYKRFNSSQNQKLIIIFSKEKLDIPIDSSYTIEKSKNLWKMKLKTAIQNQKAILKVYNFKVKKFTKSLCIKSSDDIISKVLKNKTGKVFKNFGMKINCNKYDYLIKIKVKKHKFYAEDKYSYVYKIKFNFSLEDSLLGEIDNVSTTQYFYVIPDKDIADDISKENFVDDFKLNELYQTIKGDSK